MSTTKQDSFIFTDSFLFYFDSFIGGGDLKGS